MTAFASAHYIKARARAAAFSLHDPLPLFRREFTLTQDDLGDAKIYVQSPGFAVFYINGRPITDDIFISPLSDYRKILWYNQYDVTHLLHAGVNTVGVIAGNGFFNESFTTAWNYDQAPWRDAPQFMLRLTVKDKEVLVSDGSWRTSHKHSHITFSHLRCGEFVDMRKYDTAWLQAGYDDSQWRWAIERDTAEITGELRPITCQPVREVERIAPRSITPTRQGYLVDFGLTISGYVQLTFGAPRGQEIVLRYCEDLDAQMRPKHNYMDTPAYYSEELLEFQVDKVIASGNLDTFKPLFTYHGFRYVIIEGLSVPPMPMDICAIFTHNDIARRADFTCGDPVINYIYTAGIRSTQSNMFWSLTDCPTREKLGWLNDAQATTEQALINFDILPFYQKWFEDIKADQLDSGELHGTVPTWGWGLGWGPVCDYFLFELPWRIYVYTGDASMLIGAIPHFERSIAFLQSRLQQPDPFILGDWMGSAGNSTRIPKRFVWNAYLLKSLKTICTAKRLAGQDATAYEQELDALRHAFMQTYLDADGRCTIDEQTSCAMMLVLQLYDQPDALRRQLVAAVERDGATLTCGMVGVQYLYDALSLCDRADLAYRIITESDPGYRTWYEHGATTLWEAWNGADNGSHNHHMYSNVIAWFFKSLLGIAPDEEQPGFARVHIRPRLIKDIGHVRGHMETVRGRIEVSWRYEDGGFTYTVTLPAGAVGEFQGKELTEGTHTFRIKEN